MVDIRGWCVCVCISLSIGSESATCEVVPRLMLWNMYIGGRWNIATQIQSQPGCSHICMDFPPFGYHKSQRHNPVLAHFSHTVARVLIILRSGSCLHPQVFIHFASLVDKLLNVFRLQCRSGLVKIDDNIFESLHYALNLLPLL